MKKYIKLFSLFSLIIGILVIAVWGICGDTGTGRFLIGLIANVLFWYLIGSDSIVKDYKKIINDN